MSLSPEDEKLYQALKKQRDGGRPGKSRKSKNDHWDDPITLLIFVAFVVCMFIISTGG